VLKHVGVIPRTSKTMEFRSHSIQKANVGEKGVCEHKREVALGGRRKGDPTNREDTEGKKSNPSARGEELTIL